MCRLAAYLGPPTTLSALFVEPPHSLYHQAYEPREQVSGTVNADGFGVGWYDLDRRAEPAVHKSARSIWADRSFESFGGVVTTTAALAVVRGATAPAPVEDSGAQPFHAGSWLFGHNGALTGYRSGVASSLRRQLSAERESQILSAADSEVLFALVLDRLDRGADPASALADVVQECERHQGGRANLVLTDGRAVTATRWGDSLYVRADDDSVIVASEPFDGDGAWRAVPDRHVVEASPDALTISPVV